ncbi:PREDICTED: putative F-box protein At1g49610 [Camelina sativa]|uniref:F-box protein At1g49610 n=1 Tax=Camelina sativa TaxID=90675 RepID=A0ABM0ZAW9_CAMSA|nr:PREDICTED: putative F-box protein At1g49610 [Camelina sativa]
MADGDGATTTTVALRSPPSHNHCDLIKEDVVDSISSLPDEILQHILSFIPTRFAIRTTVLSRRWRHVWSNTPCLSFDRHNLNADSINKTLDCYTSQRMMSFMLCTSVFDNLACIERWIEFAVSRKVQDLSLKITPGIFYTSYKIPDSFYTNSSVKQLSVELSLDILIPRCPVSWTSLQSLSLNSRNLSDESVANILSGCPVLESLMLSFCHELRVLDLSKSLRLKTLDVYRNSSGAGPTQIVAPHIHALALKLTNALPCTLVDVSSLKEAKLEISFGKGENLNVGALQSTTLEMLEKLQDVEKRILRENFLKILSRAELRDVPFPKFVVKDLILVTRRISYYVIPGIVRLLQNSPNLKKLTVHTMNIRSSIPESFLDKYWEGLNVDQRLSLEARVFKNIFHRNVKPNDVAKFMELMLKTTKTVEKMVVRLERYLEERDFEELLPMVPMLFHHNNVSIVLSSTKPNRRVVFNLIGPCNLSLI